MSLELSVVIPVHNEEDLLAPAITQLCAGLDKLDRRYELLLAENGSTDRTRVLGQELSNQFPAVTMFSLDQPNYGMALRTAILAAQGEIVICDEIDLCDLDFYQRALTLLDTHQAEMVVGSKAMRGANDQRPLFRRAATRIINGILWIAVDFSGTDTHGLKAFRRQALLEIVDQCVVDRDIFASEFVVRASRANKQVVEIPVMVSEKRRPTIHLARRIPRVLWSLVHLTYAIRVNGAKR